jgi:hypothetical protein
LIYPDLLARPRNCLRELSIITSGTRWTRQNVLHHLEKEGVALAQVTLACSPFGRAGSLFQGTVASEPFGDAHVIYRITDRNVNDVVDRAGETSTMHKHLLVPTDFATRLSIDSFRFVLASFFGDFGADRVLSGR